MVIGFSNLRGKGSDMRAGPEHHSVIKAMISTPASDNIGRPITELFYVSGKVNDSNEFSRTSSASPSPYQTTYNLTALCTFNTKTMKKEFKRLKRI